LPDDSGPKISTTRPARQAADTEGVIDADRAGGDRLDRRNRVALAEAHDGTLAKLLFNLANGNVNGSGAFFQVVERHEVSFIG
jgi:hypothetical protein